jgi:RHS repeat-associated protein
MSGTFGGVAYTAQETYDHFGNRNVETVTAGSNQMQPSSYLNSTAGDNRADEGIYDNAGNPKFDEANNYLYDAENRICAVQQMATGSGGSVIGYLYAPDGTRLGKNVNLTSFSCDMTKNGMLTSNGPVLTNIYTVGPKGEQLEETDGNYNLIHLNVFWEGKVLGSYSGAPFTQTNWRFALNDWVGTKRVVTNSDGSYSNSFFNGPFGDFQTPGVTGSDPSEHHFTGKERDVESGLDYFSARYYNSYVGRFMSPDPSGLAYANLFNPQSFNLYGYVQNNPLTNTDPTGLDCVHINNDTGAYEGFESGDCDNSTEALANSGHYVDGTINQISFNNQNQVIGYSGSTGDGQFDSFSGSLGAGGAAFSLNPYSLTGTAPGQSVSVTANPGAGPDISVASVFSLIAAGKIKPTSGPQVSAVPKLTTGQIYNLCALAVSLGAGGNVPGGSPRGTASLSPSEDTPPIHMPVPGKNGLAFVPMNEDAAKVENPLAGLALVGSLGDCVSAVSKAN